MSSKELLDLSWKIGNNSSGNWHLLIAIIAKRLVVGCERGGEQELAGKLRKAAAAAFMRQWHSCKHLAAFGVSVLSAIYARRAIDEAKKANRLSVHDYRLEIYREFDTVRFAVMREGLGIKHTDIAGLYRPSKESAFYFPEAISAKR